MPDAALPEVHEVTLADVVRLLWRRRWVLAAVFLVVVSGGVAYTLLKTPVYTAQATLIAVEQQDVIQRWLESRQAAQWVSEEVGQALADELGVGDPSSAAAARRVASAVDVAVMPSTPGRVDRTVHIRAGITDPGLARDVANAYLESLEVIRPTLQNVTESQLFAQFYDGQNAQDARRQAHQVALEREYWIVVDPAFAPTSPSSPDVQLNVALSLVVGLLLAILAAFTWEWAARYRVSSRAPAVPPPPGAGGGAGAGRAGGAPETFRYRGR